MGKPSSNGTPCSETDRSNAGKGADGISTSSEHPASGSLRLAIGS
jgi:hypothetical protein